MVGYETTLSLDPGEHVSVEDSNFIFKIGMIGKSDENCAATMHFHAMRLSKLDFAAIVLWALRSGH